jgi:hypothetical protein
MSFVFQLFDILTSLLVSGPSWAFTLIQLRAELREDTFDPSAEDSPDVIDNDLFLADFDPRGLPWQTNASPRGCNRRQTRQAKQILLGSRDVSHKENPIPLLFDLCRILGIVWECIHLPLHCSKKWFFPEAIEARAFQAELFVNQGLHGREISGIQGLRVAQENIASSHWQSIVDSKKKWEDWLAALTES